MHARAVFVAAMAIGCTTGAIAFDGGAPADGTGVDSGSLPLHPASVIVGPYDLDTNTTADEAASGQMGVAGVHVVSPVIVSVFETTDLPMFERAISLVTWPDRTPVAGHVQSTSNGSVVDVVFVPDAPLEGRWYALVFDVSETSLRYSTVAPNPEPPHPNDEIVRRFFPESLPIVIASVAGGEPMATDFRFGATEGVRLPSGTTLEQLVSLEVGGRALHCTAGASVDRDLLYAGQTDLVCEPADLSQPVVVRVGPGIVAPSGIPLRDQSAATQDLVLTWVPARDGLWAPAVGSEALFALTSATAGGP